MIDIIAFRDFFKNLFLHLDTLKSYCALMHVCRSLRSIGRSVAACTRFNNCGGLKIVRLRHSDFTLKIGFRKIDPSHDMFITRKKSYREGLWITYEPDQIGVLYLHAIGFYSRGVPECVLFINGSKKRKRSFKVVQCFRDDILPGDDEIRSKIVDIVERCRHEAFYMFLSNDQREEIESLPDTLFSSKTL